MTRKYLAQDKLLHDAQLLGASFDDDVLQIAFRAGEQRYDLTVSDVYEYTMFGVQKRSTVEGVYIERITEANCSAIVTEIREASAGVALLGDLEKHCASIRAGGYDLLVVEPSEGGTLMAICRADSIEFVSQSG